LSAPRDATPSIVTGRRRIAHELARSERTITRMVSKGSLPATRAADRPNKPLSVRVADLDKRR
jgi:hypothetical protein